jgi:hypothetical protein
MLTQTAVAWQRAVPMRHSLMSWLQLLPVQPDWQTVQPVTRSHARTFSPQLHMFVQFGPHVVSEQSWHVRWSGPIIWPLGQLHV